MEGALFKRSHFRPVGITPRALGEDEDTLPLLPHLRRRAIKRRVRRGGVRAIDEDGAREGHEPAEKGHKAEGALGGNGAMRGKDGTEEEDVELGLVVPDQDTRSRVQILAAFDDLEAHARHPGHGEVEGAGYGPLGNSVLADEAEGEGDDDTVGGAEDEAAVGGEEASVEGSGGDGEEGEGEEGAGEAEVEGQDADKDEEDGVHDCCGECGA